MSQTGATLLLVDTLQRAHNSPIMVPDLEHGAYLVSENDATFDDLLARGPAGMLLFLRRLVQDEYLERVSGIQGGYRLTDKGERELAELRDTVPDVDELVARAAASAG